MHVSDDTRTDCHSKCTQYNEAQTQPVPETPIRAIGRMIKKATLMLRVNEKTLDRSRPY